MAAKALIRRGGEPIPPARVVEGLERSLRQLDTDTDYVDVFQLHGVAARRRRQQCDGRGYNILVPLS